MKWLNEVFPDNDQWKKFSTSLVNVTESLKNSIEIGIISINYIIILKTNIIKIPNVTYS